MDDAQPGEALAANARKRPPSRYQRLNAVTDALDEDLDALRAEVAELREAVKALKSGE